MSSKITGRRFIELLRQSGLMDDGDLDQFLSTLPSTIDDGSVLSEQFQRANLLTSWQSRQLLAGRWRGFVLGKYRIQRHLGEGGMGRVFLAEHAVMRRKVAIKILPPERTKNVALLQRFRQEARAVAAVDHPNVVRAYDIDEAGEVHFLVMEFVDGKDLQSLVESNGPLPFDQCAEYVAQAAQGLHHAHLAGLVHRDVKPANLLVDRSGVVKVLDLGLARLQDEKEASLTVAYDQTVGTVDYQAPEQAIDSHNLDGRADIYSLGCTLYFLLTGRPPFPDGTLAQRVMRHQISQPQPIQELRADVPAWLVETHRQLTGKKPSERPADMLAVARLMQGPTLGERPRVASDKSRGPDTASDVFTAPHPEEELTLLEDTAPRPGPSGLRTTRSAAASSGPRPEQLARPSTGARLPRARPLTPPPVAPQSAATAASWPAPAATTQTTVLGGQTPAASSPGDALSALWDAAMATPLPDAANTTPNVSFPNAVLPTMPGLPGPMRSSPLSAPANVAGAEDSSVSLPNSVWALIAVGVLVGGILVAVLVSWIASFSPTDRPQGVEFRSTE